MKREQSTKAAPWYREPWPWLLMLGPLIVIIAGVITAYLAVVTSDGLVEDDYYKQGLTVNRRTERDQRAAELGVAADFVLGEEGRRIRILLRLHTGVALPDALSLRIAHPTRPGFDQDVALRAEGGGVYVGTLAPLTGGRWHVSLEDEKRQWRLVGDWVTGTESALRWTPLSRVAAAGN